MTRKIRQKNPESCWHWPAQSPKPTPNLKLKPRQDDKGADLWAQSNPITLCTIPSVLRRGFSSN